MAKSWRDGMLNLREVIFALAVYMAVMLIVTVVMLLLFPKEQRMMLWWVAPALALMVMGFLWGRGGDKWSILALFVVVPSAKSFLAFIGMSVAMGVGYGIGVLSKRVSHNRIHERNRNDSK